MATNQEKIDYLLSLKPQETGPSNAEKLAVVQGQSQATQAPVAQPQDIEATQAPVTQPTESSIFSNMPFMDRGQIAEPNYSMTPSFGEKSFSELTENVFKSLDNIGLGVARSVVGAGDEAASKYMGEIASIPTAYKGAQFVAKLATGHPLLKSLATIAGGAGGAGVGQFFGEVGEDVWNGTTIDYKNALDEGVTTAQWDIYGGLVLGSLGTISKKALRMNGIESTDDAVKTARTMLNKYGADLTWFQATGSNMSSVMEGIGRVGIYGKEIIDAAAKKQEVALQKNLEELMTDTSIQDFGSNVQKVLTDSKDNLRKEFSPQYEAIYEAGADIPINLTEYGKEVDKQIAKKAGARKDKKARSANPTVNDVNDIVTRLDDNTTMSGLNEVLKDLRSIKRAGFDLKTDAGSVGGGYANREIKKLEEIMGEAVQRLDPSLQGKLDFLNMNYQKAAGRLNSRTMRVVASKDPSDVGDWVYKNPTKHKEFMRFLGQARNNKAISKEEHKAILEDYRSGYIKKQIAEEGASVQAMSTLSKKLRIAKNSQNLQSVLGIGTTNRLKNILNTAELTQKHVGAKLGLVIGGQQAQTVKGMALATAGFTLSIPTMVGLFVGPASMAKAASSAKTLGEWLSINSGLKAAVDSGNDKKLGIVMRRLTQWTAESSEKPEYTGLAETPE